MTEEIKEILYCDMYNDLDDKKYEKLLNYITNLQKEKEELQRKYLTINENNQNMQEEMVRTWKKCDDYKQRNEKAVEYIENHSRFEPPYYEMREFNNKANLNELYNILEGGDEEWLNQ